MGQLFRLICSDFPLAQEANSGNSGAPNQGPFGRSAERLQIESARHCQKSNLRIRRTHNAKPTRAAKTE